MRTMPGIIRRIGHNEETKGNRIMPASAKITPDKTPTTPLLLESFRLTT